MKRARSIIQSWRTELRQGAAAHCASLFFSLHVLTLLLSIAASQAFLAAATVAYLTHLIRTRPAINFPPVKLPLLLFCLATLNSVLWAQYPAAGWGAVRKLVLFSIMLLGANLIRSARHLRALFQGLFLVSALAGLRATAQFIHQYHNVRHLHPTQVYYYMTLTRIHGFMGHWMNFGGQQMLVFSALLAFLLASYCVIPSAARYLGLPGGAPGGEGLGKIPRGTYPERTGEMLRCTQDDSERAPNDTIQHWNVKWLYWLVMAVVSTSIILNFTRSVWLGCLVATLYLVARWKPRTLWLIPFVLLVAYLAAPSMIRHRVSLAFHPTDDPALSIRLEIWGAGLRMVRAHPWVGVGPQNIPLVYSEYLPAGTLPEVGYHNHMHDDFLQIAAERGLPCLVAWLWFMLALAWHILRVRRGLSSLRWVADAAFAGWLAFFVEGFFEFNFGTSPVLMVFLFLMTMPFMAERLESCGLNLSPQRAQSSQRTLD